MAMVSMAPVGMAAIRRARSATMAKASSGVNTPARQAAVYSPKEWPSIMSGLMPSDAHHWAQARLKARIAG